MSSQDEGQQAGLAVVAGVVSLVVAIVLFLGISSASRHGAKAEAAVSAAPAAAQMIDELLDITPQGPALAVLYFESGAAAVAPEADAALMDVVKALAADSGKQVLLSGYHDASGDAVTNAELAKERAKAVRAALVLHGVPVAQVRLRKPEVTLADGPAQEARRVEIRLIELK
jgi:outer membrane protein OmpA-like peptidoglycan-associated protein